VISRKKLHQMGIIEEKNEAEEDLIIEPIFNGRVEEVEETEEKL
jgi:hypothetical protein